MDHNEARDASVYCPAVQDVRICCSVQLRLRLISVVYSDAWVAIELLIKLVRLYCYSFLAVLQRVRCLWSLTLVIALRVGLLAPMQGALESSDIERLKRR